jgi:hypothetical protein
MRFLAVLLIIGLLGATPAPSGPAPSPFPSIAPGLQTVVVPGGTSVIVSLTEAISSGTAHANDQVGIMVRDEVDVNGMAVILAGASGHATVTNVEQAAGNGSGGKLAMSVDWVYSADGGKVQLSQTNHASETGDNKGAASTATLISWVLLGPLGFFAHNFVRGKDVTIDTSKRFAVFVDHDVHVQTSQHSRPPGQEYDH